MMKTRNFNLTKVIILAGLLLALTNVRSPAAAAATPPPITVLVEGKPVTMLVPPTIVDGRTLVSVRSVGEAVGGTVEWDQVKREARVNRRSDSVVMTVGKREALVNGKLVAMDVPAQLVSDRTMVPLRFLVENLGGMIEWDDRTRTINILRKPTQITRWTYVRDVGKSTLTLTLSEPLASISPKTAGNLLSFDLYPATVNVDEPVKAPLDSLMKTLQLRADGRTVHLEANLWNAPAYRQVLSPDGTQLTLEFPHSVTSVQFRQDGRTPTVEIAATGRLNYSATTLQNPPRLVLDLAGASLAPGAPPSVDGSPASVKSIRTARNTADNVRVVLDLVRDLPYEIISTDLGLQVQFLPQIQAVKTEKLPGKTRLTFAASLPLDARVTANEAQKRIQIELPQGGSNLASPTVDVGDGTINSITVGPGATRGSALISINLPYFLGYTLVSKNGDPNIIVDVQTSPVVGKRIWIDAGHGKIPGGNDDPGSIGRTYRIKEKTINLDVALELQRKLQAAGATVYMTRTGDEGIDFLDRPAKVNAVKPAIDLFVSIHHNSSTSVTTRGTETYYWSTNPKSRLAALAVHAGVVKALGFPDRRVRTADYYVIKYTQAPSILVELGYLSNPEEEKAIAEPGNTVRTYPNKAAEGIKEGIFDYFWQEIRGSVAN